MPGKAQLVIGTAGAGKSTYCKAVRQHCDTIRRVVHLVNLDPAAEDVDDTNFSLDLRDLISADDAMEELGLGPNGALVYCMEYLMDNLEWLDDQIGEFDSDYLIIDCPGQIELYTHLPVIPRVVDLLQQRGYQVCAVYCVDATSAADASRFIGSAMAALACMVHLKVSHINVLTKTDLLPSRHTARRLCDSDPTDLLSSLNQETGDRFTALNSALAQLLEDFNMVGFLPMTATKPSSITAVLSSADFALQYGEDEEPKEPKGDDDNME